MVFTTHPEFNDKTEALEVAKEFAAGIQGKAILITGGNRNGLAFTTAHAFASQKPAHIILLSRSLNKLQECIDALKEEFPDVKYHAVQIDLSSQKSVRAAAAEILAMEDVPDINIVVNNAGVMLVPERTLSENGIELHFATNHIGHFLLTVLIMPKLIKAASHSPAGATRVVNVSAIMNGKTGMRWSDRNFDRVNKTLPPNEQPTYEIMNFWGYPDAENMTYVPAEGYVQSKMANILFGVGLTDRLFAKYGIRSVALHPGVIQTDLGRYRIEEEHKAMIERLGQFNLSIRSAGAGSSTTLVAALDPALAVDVGSAEDKANHPTTENYGAFLMDCQITDGISPLVVSSSEASKLWAESEKLVGETFSW